MIFMVPSRDEKIIRHCRLLAESFRHWMKRPLIVGHYSDEELAEKMYYAPFVIVSHGTEEDPVFNYANQCAQQLWQIGWEAFVSLPSRFSVEPMRIEDRQALLERSRKDGFSSDYSGIRIASDGKKFRIENTILWNVVDENGKYHGQAATFETWKFL